MPMTVNAWNIHLATLDAMENEINEEDPGEHENVLTQIELLKIQIGIQKQAAGG